MTPAEISALASSIITDSDLEYNATEDEITQAVDATNYLDSRTVTPDERRQIIAKIKELLPHFGWR